MLFEGDIQLDDELEREIKHGPDDSRNAVRERKRLWKDRIIPYRIPSWMSMYFSVNSRPFYSCT